MMNDRDFEMFIQNIKKKSGIDLGLYKKDQMKRRLTTLYQKSGCKNFDEFYRAMAKDNDLFNVFLDRMTINVTEFFRNPDRWKILQSQVLPQLLREKGRIKSWSAACSTGEEPYTLAMMLKEMNVRFTLEATDLDEGVLNKAQQGIYVKNALKEVPNPYLTKYFTTNEIAYQISNDIKKSVSFKKQNLLADSFTSGYDLIICRNVTIYFTEEAKDILYQKFSKALRPGGVLFVGSTEQIAKPQNYGLAPTAAFFYKKI